MSQKRIIIVNANESEAEFYKVLLKLKGYNVESCDLLVNIYELVQSECPDLILCSYRPSSGDIEKHLAMIRQKCSRETRPKIVMMTNIKGLIPVRDDLIDGYLQEPVDASEFLAYVKKILLM